MRILRIASIDIDLHWTFILLLALLLIGGGLDAFIVAFVIFGSVVLHELSHSLVARLYDVSVKRIVLLPIGGMAVIEEFAMPSEVELRVAIAGPALSFALALISFGVELVSPFPFITSIAVVSKEANFLICAFNLLPALPLDGGRVWRALRQRHKSFLLSTKEAVALSKLIVVVLVFAGFAFAFLFDAWGFLFWDAIIALFIFIGAGMEWDAAVFKTASEGITVRDAMRRDVVCASGNESLLDAFELAYSARVRNILLVSKSKFGVVSLSSFEGIPRKSWANVKLKSISTVPISCSPCDEALGAWKRMRSAGVELAPVVEKKKLAGVVTSHDIERLIHLNKISLVS